MLLEKILLSSKRWELRSYISQRHLKKIRRARPIFLSSDKSDFNDSGIRFLLDSTALFSILITFLLISLSSIFIRKCLGSKLEMAARSPFLGNVNTSDPICSLYHQRSLRFWPSLYYGSARQSIFSLSSLVTGQHALLFLKVLFLTLPLLVLEYCGISSILLLLS